MKVPWKIHRGAQLEHQHIWALLQLFLAGITVRERGRCQARLWEGEVLEMPEFIFAKICSAAESAAGGGSSWGSFLSSPCSPPTGNPCKAPGQEGLQDRALGV